MSRDSVAVTSTYRCSYIQHTHTHTHTQYIPSHKHTNSKHVNKILGYKHLRNDEKSASLGLIVILKDLSE